MNNKTHNHRREQLRTKPKRKNASRRCSSFESKYLVRARMMNRIDAERTKRNNGLMIALLCSCFFIYFDFVRTCNGLIKWVNGNKQRRRGIRGHRKIWTRISSLAPMIRWVQHIHSRSNHVDCCFCLLIFFIFFLSYDQRRPSGTRRRRVFCERITQLSVDDEM